MNGEWLLPWASTIANVNQNILDRYIDAYSYLQAPSAEEIPQTTHEIQHETILLLWQDRSAFLKRGKALLRVQYPELAAGDLYHALQLVEGREKDSVILYLAQALFMANSFLECIEIVKQATASTHELRKLQRRARASLEVEQEECGRSGTTDEEEDKSGEIVTQPYPWLNPSWQLRQSGVLTAINETLKKDSQERCEVRKSGSSSQEHDCYGIFAANTITKGERLFKETTAICATSGPTRKCGFCAGELTVRVKLECCSSEAEFCSYSCMNRAKHTYHESLCGRNLDNSNSSTGNQPGTQDSTNSRLWLRILAMVKQEMKSNPDLYQHPLDVPFLNQLTLNNNTVVRFSLKSNIIQPTEALRQLGIGPFDTNFDTWVLQIIARRMEVNSREWVTYNDKQYGGADSWMMAISPLYSFFNHSWYTAPPLPIRKPH